MYKAKYTDKAIVINILINSFFDNSSVNYIIKQDHKKYSRIKYLMDYSFDLCYFFGEIYLSEDRNGCALILFPEKKKNKFKSICLGIKFIIRSLDLSHLKKAIIREAKIKKLQPEGSQFYLWFIGVQLRERGKGIGSNLLGEVIKNAVEKGRPVLLETSGIDNVQWYQKFGFELYNELDLGYQLYFMKRE